MTGLQRIIIIAAQQPTHVNLSVRNLNIGPYGKFGRQARARRNALGAPQNGATVSFAGRIVLILFVERDFLFSRIRI
jgi:hypothetical protein